ncbi:MAG: hypothetical protein L0Z50_08620 [Verrucomicrobiales bacterium]|nr:hypothetical protein [Verrucomicrobiales bacterium]
MILVSDFQISPASQPSPEQTRQDGSRHSGGNGVVAERGGVATDVRATAIPSGSRWDAAGSGVSAHLQKAHDNAILTPSLPCTEGLQAQPDSSALAAIPPGEPNTDPTDSEAAPDLEPVLGKLGDATEAAAISPSPSPEAPGNNSTPSLIDAGDARTIVPYFHGTPAAKADHEMKNAGNRNEIPRAGVKEVPGAAERADQSRPPLGSFEATSDTARLLARDSSTVSFVTLDTSLDRSSGFELESDKTGPSSSPVRQLTEMILTEVQTFRQTGSDRVEVILRPDAGTEISLEFRLRNGEVEACARCRQGDFQTLTAQWPQLQQTLSQQGIRLTELNDSQVPGSSTSGTLSQNQSDGQRRRENLPPTTPLDDLAPRRMVTQPPSAGRAHSPYFTKRLVDSWA